MTNTDIDTDIKDENYFSEFLEIRDDYWKSYINRNEFDKRVRKLNRKYINHQKQEQAKIWNKIMSSLF